MKTLFKRGLFVILSLLLAGYCQAQDLWDGTTASSFHGGSGTEEDPYQIRTGAQLMYFISQINAGDDFAGKTVKLMNDIDMYGNAFYAKKPFCGTFDGGSHILTLGFNKRWIALESGRYASTFPINDCPVLFNIVNGHIHHLGIIGRQPSSSTFYGLSSMAIANTLAEGGCISDCYYSLRCNFASASGYLAAIAVYNNGTICNCYVESATYRYDGRVNDNQLGGIVYCNYESGLIQNCYYYNDKLGVESYQYGAGSIIYDGFYGGTSYIGNTYTWKEGTISNDIYHFVFVNTPLYRYNSGVIENSKTNEEIALTEYIGILNQWVDENPSHDHWYSEGKMLESFNPGNECLVEFIDSKFNNTFPYRIVNKGEVIGEFPTADADWTLVGWTRSGEEVGPEYVVNSDITLFAKWEQHIRKQPSEKSMSFDVDDVSHASFQWYRYLAGEEQVLGEWTSTNHSDDSSQNKVFTFSAKAGCKVEFDYTVSSEESGDYFSAYIKSSVATNSTLLASKSGEESGHIEYVIADDGEYTLTLYYRKDEDTRNGDDKVSVTNIKISDRLEELGTNAHLSQSYIDKKGLYYCVVTYSNTGVMLISDIVDIEDVDYDTDISALDNVVFIDKVETFVGQQKTLSVKMKNTVGIQTVQFDLYLPDGVTVAKDGDGFDLIELSTERTTARKMDSFSSRQMSDGAYRVLINSSGGYTFDGEDGEIARVTVNIANDMAEGDYPLILRDIVLVNESSEGFETEYVKTTLTVSDYSPGDVNGDGKVNAIDLNAIVNYILESRTFPFTFVEKAADLNGDLKVNAIDVNMVTNMILGSTAPKNAKAQTPICVGVLEEK